MKALMKILALQASLCTVILIFILMEILDIGYFNWCFLAYVMTMLFRNELEQRY